MRLAPADLEFLAKAILKRAARLEAEAQIQREQVRQLVAQLAEVRRAGGEQPR